jgi:hypothetical protein
MARRIYKNYPEELFCKWIEEKGFQPIKRGWPDFFCFNPKTKELMLVEVKPTSSRMLKREQATVMYFLATFGIKVYKWDPFTKHLKPIQEIYKRPPQNLPQDTTADVSSI